MPILLLILFVSLLAGADAANKKSKRNQPTTLTSKIRK